MNSASKDSSMLERYGEVCTQKTAAQMLSVGTRTIQRYIKTGLIRAAGRGIDARSICEYLENLHAPERGKAP